MSMLANTTAVILAGGLGTRLSSVVPGKPKVLAEVCGRPFIEYLLDQLDTAGVRSVVLCTGYLADEVRDQLGPSYRNMVLSYSCEATPLGTGGALRLALPLLASNPVLVLNGDSYIDAQLGEFFEWHNSRQSPASLLLSETPDTQRYGRVDVDEEGHVLCFAEKSQTQGAGWVNAGVYLLDRYIIECIKPGLSVSLEHEVFPGWIGHGLNGYRSKGKLWDIGVPDAYSLANQEFANYVYKN